MGKNIVRAVVVGAGLWLALVGGSCDGDAGPAGADWPGPAPAAYMAADGIAGGAAYAKWWTTDAAYGAGKSDPTATLTVAKDFYRCKSCHAWDGLGNAGSYADRTGQSTGTASRPDVSSINLRSSIASSTYQELYGLIVHSGGRPLDAADNRHPDYTGTSTSGLSSNQVWNLVKFMKEEWVEPGTLYDLTVEGVMYWDYSAAEFSTSAISGIVDGETVTGGTSGAIGTVLSGGGTDTIALGNVAGQFVVGETVTSATGSGTITATAGKPYLVKPKLTYSNIGKNGNATNGKTVYTNTCQTCHGADGRTVDIGGRSLGQFIREKPHEAWFKAKFGESGKMNSGLVTSTSDLKDLYKALINTTDFPNP